MKQRHNDKLMYGIEHGGNFGINKTIYIETWFLDRLYTFSNNHEKIGTCEIYGMPSVKLLDKGREHKQNKKVILYSGTCMPRYISKLVYDVQLDMIQYYNNQLLFMNHLNEAILKNFSFRPYREDFGWDFLKRYSKEIPQVKVEDWTISLQDRLNDTALYIVDHISTTWIESMGRGIPTIIILNPSYNSFYDEVDLWFQKLKKVGVYFEDFIEAADTVNSIADNIEQWWSDTNRKQVVDAFCDKFVIRSDYPEKRWFEEINKLTTK